MNYQRNWVITVAGIKGQSGSDDLGIISPGGSFRQSSFNMPSNILISENGNDIYISDYGNRTIRKFIINNRTVSTIAGSAGQSGSVDGVGSNSRFDFPTDLIIDGNDLIVLDSTGLKIRKIYNVDRL